MCGASHSELRPEEGTADALRDVVQCFVSTYLQMSHSPMRAETTKFTLRNLLSPNTSRSCLDIFKIICHVRTQETRVNASATPLSIMTSKFLGASLAESRTEIPVLPFVALMKSTMRQCILIMYSEKTTATFWDCAALCLRTTSLRLGPSSAAQVCQ